MRRYDEYKKNEEKKKITEIDNKNEYIEDNKPVKNKGKKIILATVITIFAVVIAFLVSFVVAYHSMTGNSAFSLIGFKPTVPKEQYDELQGKYDTLKEDFEILNDKSTDLEDLVDEYVEFFENNGMEDYIDRETKKIIKTPEPSATPSPTVTVTPKPQATTVPKKQNTNNTNKTTNNTSSNTVKATTTTPVITQAPAPTKKPVAVTSKPAPTIPPKTDVAE